MSARPARRLAMSRVFAADCDVAASYPRLAQARIEPVLFGDAVWDFREVPDIPTHVRTSRLSLDWLTFTSSRWELLLRELAAAKMLPLHPSVVHLPNRRVQPLPISALYTQLTNWRRWLKWLDAHDVAGLAAVDQRLCDRYLGDAAALAPKSRLATVVAPVRDFYAYGAVLSESYSAGFMPWEGRSGRKVAGVVRKTENETPFIPDEVISPLLAGALFYVETAAADLLAARAEVRAMEARRIRTVRSDDWLDAVLDAYRAAQQPLPLRDPSHARAAHLSDDDPLADLSFRLIGRKAGLGGDVGYGFGPRDLTPSRRSMLEAALSELGAASGGLWTPITAVTSRDGVVGPWRESLAPRQLQFELGRLVCACVIVVGGLSGMRAQEVLDLGRGCVQRMEGPNGRVRWQVHGRVFKGRDPRGEHDTWTVIEPVVAAIRVLEALAPTGAAQKLFTPASWEVQPGGRAKQRLDVVRPLNLFLAWQNAHGAAAGLPPIPDVNGEAWRLDSRQLRRTLARQLSFRPHGTLAAMHHLKHISVVTAEGYWGAIGESATDFLAEVEEQMQLARVDKLVEFHGRHERGEPFGGGGGKHLRDELTAIDREMDAFSGTLEQREDRLRALFRKRPGTLHVGMFNVCNFTDPTRAMCLRGVEDKSAPLIAACQPTKCGNSVITDEHTPRWQGQLVQIKDLRADRKLPKHERERLGIEETRIRDVVEGAGPSGG
jgi:hypothetical protein